MALTIGDNFSYQGAKPLDTRLVYDTLAQMKAKAESTLYPGIIAFCKADGKNYQWKPTNVADLTLGKWREFETGGSSDNIVEGYRNPANGLFYEEAAFTTAIAGASKTIYVDIPNNLPYRWDGTAFVAIAGSGGHEIRDADNNAMAVRDALQFAGDMETTDDTTSGSEKTVVTPHALTSSEWGEVVAPLPGQRKEGIVIDERGNEYVVGEYIQADGKKKPIYEKTITGLNIPIRWNNQYFAWSDTISPPIPNVEILIHAEGHILSNLSSNIYYTTCDLAGSISGATWSFTCSPSINGTDAYLETVIIQYTKTTDTPT